MPSSAQQLHTLFQQQLSAATQLLNALKSETDALVERDFEKLQQSTNDKTTLSQALETFAQQQTELLLTNHKEQSSTGLNQFIGEQSLAAQKVLAQKKQELETLLQECQTINIINGNIIAASQQSTEAMLSIIKGQTENEGLVYSAGGKTVTSTSAQPLTKA